MNLARYYRCGRGHAIAAHIEILRCPAVVRGQPCPGEVVETDISGRRRRTVR